MKRSYRVLRLFSCLLLFLWTPLGTGCVMNMAWVRQAPELSDNLDAFREMEIPAERFSGYSEWEKSEYEKLARDFLYYRGKIPREAGGVPVFSWYYMLLPEEKTDDYVKAWQILLRDIKCFPVADDPWGKETVSYEDSWGKSRSYGGNRVHEGTDIMASNQERGYFSVVSVSDGVIEKKGWLKLGGYRIGVRSPSGAYFYYAHLAGYADGIEEGTRVQAGQVLGQMGDSGYGEEGTVGQFAVHLHFGIYMKMGEKEISVNPYEILKATEREKRT